MAELSVDIWDQETTTQLDSSGLLPHRPRRAPITHITIWVECYSQMAALLSTRFPEKAPEFWVYQATIIRASRNYDNSAWVAYDRQFHREALASKDLNWSVPNHRLYNEAFTGRVRSIPRCTICLSAHHLRPVNPICLQLLLGTSSRLHGLVGLYPLMLLVPLGGGLLCAGITMTIAVRILGAVICISVSIARSFTLIVIAPRTLQIIPLKFLGLTGCSSH